MYASLQVLASFPYDLMNVRNRFAKCLDQSSLFHHFFQPPDLPMQLDVTPKIGEFSSKSSVINESKIFLRVGSPSLDQLSNGVPKDPTSMAYSLCVCGLWLIIGIIRIIIIKDIRLIATFIISPAITITP